MSNAAEVERRRGQDFSGSSGDNSMQLQGHVKNGVVVPDGDFSLPEDSLVWLIPCPEPQSHPASAHHAELLAETRRIAALPPEVDQI